MAFRWRANSGPTLYADWVPSRPMKVGHYRPASETPFKDGVKILKMAFCWRANSGPTLYADWVATGNLVFSCVHLFTVAN